MTIIPKRSALIAYAAGLVAIGGLMTLVAVGGSVVTANKPTAEIARAQATVFPAR